MTEVTQGRAISRRAALNRLLTPWTVVVAAPAAVAVLDPPNLVPVVTSAASSLAGTLVYIVIAIGLIAYLKAAGAEATIAEAFKGREVRMIFLAAFLGGLAPFCSCEVIPFIAALLSFGTPLSAVMAFWLSSPLIDPPTVLITASALGWPFAIGKAVAAVSLGLFGGFAIKLAVQRGFLSEPLRAYSSGGCGCRPSPFKGKPEWTVWADGARRSVFAREFQVNGLFLVKWLALAYVLEALLVTYVPAGLIAGAVGGKGLAPIVIAALVGMPAYLNSYVAPPLLAGLMAQGMSAGAAMAFVVAGAVSSIPAMAAVWSLVTARVFAAYLGLGIIGAILAGIIFQILV